MRIILLPLLYVALLWCNLCIAGDAIDDPLEINKPFPKQVPESESQIVVQEPSREERMVNIPPRRGPEKRRVKKVKRVLRSNYMEKMRRNRRLEQIVKGFPLQEPEQHRRRFHDETPSITITKPPDSQYMKMAAMLNTVSSEGDTVVTVFNGTTIYGLNTTIVNLQTETNGTVTISSFKSRTSMLTPMPTAAYYIFADVAYDSYEYFANVSNYEMGALFPMTLNGIPYLTGVQYVEAFKCQLGILNSDRSILPNSYVAYMIRNSDSKIPLATGEAFEFDRQYYFMVVGPPYNDQVAPISYLYSPQNVSFVSYSAAAIDLGNSTRCPSFFRTIPSDNFQARAMAETMRLLGWTYVAALFTNDAYGLSGFEAFTIQAGRNRIQTTCTTSFTPGTIDALEGFSSCVADSDASVVLLWSTTTSRHKIETHSFSIVDQDNAADALAFLYNNATNSRLTFIASDRWAFIEDPSTFNDTKSRTGYSFPLEFINGTLAYFPQIGQLGQYQACASQVKPSNTNYTEFISVWETEFKCTINDTDTLPPCPQQISERTFECRCTGDENFATLPPAPLVNYVQDAVLVMYSALNSLMNPTSCAMLKYPSICSLDIFSTSDYVQALSLVSVTGLTGPIQFNQTKPDRRRATFDIYQYNGTGQYRQVGFWNISGPFLGATLLGFKTYPAIPVSSIRPDTVIFGKSFWPTFVSILAIITNVTTLAVLIFFTIFRKSRVVRRTNFLWIWLILLGSMMMCSAVAVWTATQSTTACTIKAILSFMGLGLIIACIVVKVERISRVIINMSHMTMVLKNSELLSVVTLVLIPDIALLLAYLFADGGLPTATITQSDVDTTYVFIACTAGSAQVGTTIVAIFMAYNAILTLICIIVLAMGKFLRTAYSEAFYLFLVLIDFIIMGAIMIPLYYTVVDRKGSMLQKFLLRSLATVFAMILTVILVSYPKVQAIIRQEERKRKGHHQASRSDKTHVSSTVELTGEDGEGSSSGDDYDDSTGTSKPLFISQTRTYRSHNRSSQNDSGESAERDSSALRRSSIISRSTSSIRQ